MKNIIDYVKKYGEKTFSELPFTEVDSLVLSQLSYLKFDKVIPYDTDICLKDLKKSPKLDTLFAYKPYEKNNRQLFSLAAKSPRFSELLIRDYVNITEKEREIQFSAMVFKLSEDLAYMAFRGTDDSIIGWHEDFNMAYKSPVPAQLYSVSYLNNFASKSSEALYIGGHSKGGNLAIYSCAKCLSEYQPRIRRIYSHDGPGFKAGIITQQEMSVIEKKIRKSVPQSSIVGMLMQTQGEYDVVDCRSLGIAQHNPYNWKISGHRFKKQSNIHRHTEIQNESLNLWLGGMTEEETGVFVETLFETLEQADLNSLSQLSEDFTGVLKRIRTATENMSAEKKMIMERFLRELVKINTDMGKNSLKNGLKQTFNTGGLTDALIRLRDELNGTPEERQ
ncbi:MAG: DUF2974 domain-containing protein [Lachnospiraceae bacterium]|nr:DUF2974 domain-containing protein [Lachnospiraceae bacterium]